MRTKLLMALVLAINFGTWMEVQAIVVAESTAEFAGVQGRDGWSYGFRKVDGTGSSQSYDPERDITLLAGGQGEGEWNGSYQQWTGAGWKTRDGLEMGESYVRPVEGFWIIRRWRAVELGEKTAVSLIWTLAKEDSNCGNGVTGALFVNGKIADQATIKFDRTSVLNRTNYALLCPNDTVDLVIHSLGTDGGNDARWDIRSPRRRDFVDGVRDDGRWRSAGGGPGIC